MNNTPPSYPPPSQRPLLSVNIQHPPPTQSFQPSIQSFQPQTHTFQTPVMPPQRKSSLQVQQPQRPASPGEQVPPPHSPISPKAVAGKLADMDPYNAPRVMSRPPEPVSIAESHNPDVMALRSALMILQVQRETARRDMRELAQLKEEAVRDPEGYVKELVKREHHKAQRGGVDVRGKDDLLAPTMRYLVDGLGEKSEFLQPDEELTTATGEKETESIVKKVDQEGEEEEDEESEEDVPKSKFATAPKSQNIYRMPPVNWAKYQLSGAGLEKLSHDQAIRPTAGQPATLIPDSGPQTERYVMAAAYQPVVDAHRMGSISDHPMQTRRKGTKR